MRIPETFVPNNLPDENLEKLLKREKVERELSDKKYDYHCAVCGKLAGSIEIFFGKEYDDMIFLWPTLELPKPKSRLVIKSFLNTATLQRNERFLGSIMEYLENEDLRSVLGKLNGDNLAFYCPTCDKCYCKNHRENHSKK